MIGRLGPTLTARRFVLTATIAAGPSSVLMGSHDRRVHTHLPHDHPRRIGEETCNNFTITSHTPARCQRRNNP